MRSLSTALLAIMALVGVAVGGSEAASEEVQPSSNPLLDEWSTPYGMPPFDRIREEHFLPAIHEGIAALRVEVEEIASSRKRPTFANTIEALDGTGGLLTRTRLVLLNLQAADTTEGLQAIARESAPLVAAVEDDIYLDERLFRRVEKLYDKRHRLKLDPVEARLLEEAWKRFRRSGAGLSGEDKVALREVNQELSVLGLQFGENLLAETNRFQLMVEDEEDLAGLPPSLVEASRDAARDAGFEEGWLFTLHGPSLWPFVQNAENRDLRRRMIEGYARRGDQGDELDNKGIVARIAHLRLQKARLLGYDDWASYVLEERMAESTEGVMGLLDQLWPPALDVAKRELGLLTEAARADGIEGSFHPWDWHYYAERVRKERHGVDDGDLRPYFSLDDTVQGVFTVANKLYGITFREVTDVPVYHEEVQVYEVLDGDGSHLGIFLTDYHPRPGKRGGAWCSRFRGLWDVTGEPVRPIVINVGNFTRPSGDAPALLSIDEVETLYHEMGHALHSLFSEARYQGLSYVPRDFVELPSQILEHWVLEPEVLALYARHHETGEPIPAELVAQLKEARRFNQGFETAEFLAAALLDMAWHTGTEGAVEDVAVEDVAVEDVAVEDVNAFEVEALEKIGLIPEILPRYRSTYFNHVFGGSGSYSAGYYSYIWSGVLDADAFQAFKENGIFHQETAQAFREEILKRGGTRDAMEMYKAFRGREPVVEPLLEHRGLVASDSE